MYWTRKVLLLGAALALLLGVSVVGEAATVLTGCRNITSAGDYTVGTDIDASGDCFTVQADHVGLNLQGHRLSGNGTGKGITDGGNKHSGLIITNGTVMNFGTGIDLSASSLITIELMDVSGNLVDGIFTGGSTTVTGICPSNVLKITGTSSLRPHPPSSRRFR
jgi:hypothetical protein